MFSGVNMLPVSAGERITIFILDTRVNLKHSLFGYNTLDFPVTRNMKMKMATCNR